MPSPASLRTASALRCPPSRSTLLGPLRLPLPHQLSSPWRHPLLSLPLVRSAELPLRCPPPACPAFSGRTGSGGSGGSFHDSEIVQQEALLIFRDFELLTNMQPKFQTFDLEGKRIYVSRMEDFLSRLRIFMMRYQLSDSPEAKQVIHRFNVQLLEAGLNTQVMYEQLEACLQQMRNIVDGEAQLDVGGRAQLTLGLQQAVGQRPAEWPNLVELMKDPEFTSALDEPEALAAVKAVLEDPQNYTKYVGNPKIASLLMKIFGRYTK
eukprot:SM000113S24076  [mRNA]  locus=s113:453200:454834:+ [translate_table: standard]